MCPTCKSHHAETINMNSKNNNRTTCLNCGYSGNYVDWNIIYNLNSEIDKLKLQLKKESK